MKHFLSEPGTWKATAEFVFPDGKIMHSEGEAVISVNQDEIINAVKVVSNEIRLQNSYRITPVSPTKMAVESLDPEMQRLVGTLDEDRNMLFFKFGIEGSAINGYQILHRNRDVCYAQGALYDGDVLTSTWMVTLNKM